MSKWEYVVLESVGSGDIKRANRVNGRMREEQKAGDFYEFLHQLGDAEWELVGTDNDCHILKRPKP